MQNEIAAQFKVVILGDLGVGKSTFLNRFTDAQIQKKHVGNNPVQIYSIPCQTNLGNIKIDVWDVADQSNSKQLFEEFYLSAHGAILMFDLTNRQSYKSIPFWYNNMTKINDCIPMVLVGNKVQDQKNRKIKPKQIIYHRKKNLKYYDMSAKSNYQVEQPLLFIMRKLVGDPKLMFVQALNLKPQQFPIDIPYIEALQKEWDEVNFLPLPDEEDE